MCAISRLFKDGNARNLRKGEKCISAKHVCAPYIKVNATAFPLQLVSGKIAQYFLGLSPRTRSTTNSSS